MAKKSARSGGRKKATKSAKAASKKASSKKASSKKSSSKKASRRELVDTGTDKRFVRRDAKGQFDEVEDVGRSLSQDRRRKAKTASKSGQGDRGDRQSTTKKGKKGR